MTTDQLSSCKMEEGGDSDATSLGHVGIFVRGVLGSLDVLLVNQHLNALLDDGDGRGETCLQRGDVQSNMLTCIL